MTGVKDLGKSFEGGLTWSFSETEDKPVSVWTKSLKVCVSACTKVGDDGEVMVLCFSILERERGNGDSRKIIEVGSKFKQPNEETQGSRMIGHRSTTIIPINLPSDPCHLNSQEQLYFLSSREPDLIA